jgi:predicted nucleotidyltransferase
MTVAQIEIPQAAIAGFCQRNGIQRLSLFGSVLTGRFSDASDIDLLVEFLPGERVGFFRLADLEQELSGLFGGRKIDLRTSMDLSRYFRGEVVQSAVVLYAQP